jgi:surface antigen
MTRIASSLALALLAVTIATPVFADPPSHAPAHGWRKKHDPDYQGYSGKKWQSDYGILQGQCDAKSLGETLGKSVGGQVGSQVGGGQGKEIAILVGEVLGQAIGTKVFKGMGDIKDVQGTDRACLAHALELARGGQMVAWTNPVNNVRYLLTPQRAHDVNGRQCRDFKLNVAGAGVTETTSRTACVNATGSWEMLR